MFALLGEILFETLTSPEALTISTGYSYGEHRVLEGPPKLQWLANELAEISLELLFHVAFTSPALQMSLLRAAAEDHQARALVFGNGVHRGYFVIKQIEEIDHQMADDGSYVAISAKLELREWVPTEDPATSANSGPSKAPGIVSLPSPFSANKGNGDSLELDSLQPVGPHNLVPTSEIVQLSKAGPMPGVIYIPVAYSQPGVSGVLKRDGAGVDSILQHPGDVLASRIVRAG